MKSFSKLLLTITILTAASAAHAAPSLCLGKPTAWKKNVLQALVDANIKGAKMSEIAQTGFDAHDPQYTVTIQGDVYYVSCDDSGDNDCQCSVEKN